MEKGKPVASATIGSIDKRKSTASSTTPPHPDKRKFVGKSRSTVSASTSQNVKGKSIEKTRSAFTSANLQEETDISNIKEHLRARGDCKVSQSTSHTQFFRKNRYEDMYERITTDDYYGVSESISGSSDTFHCVHGADGRQYTEKGLLKRNFLKELDPIPRDTKWHENCNPAYGWDMATKLEFLITDPMGVNQMQRLEDHLRDFAVTADKGYKLRLLDKVCAIVDYLVESLPSRPNLREGLVLMLKNMAKPILLDLASDVVTYFETLANYIGYLGYLTMRMDDKDPSARELLELVSRAVLWQLSAADSERGAGAAQLRHTVAAAAPVLHDTVIRMLAVASPCKFPTYMDMALILALDTVDSCLEMMKQNIMENIFYRFNPYFPEKQLPAYDINPADLQDHNVKLGESSVNMSKTLSVLLILVRTVKNHLEDCPQYSRLLPCPDDYAQRCFVWAYRYECRAREHRHQRNTLTVIANGLLHIFGNRLTLFADCLFPDVLSLSVMTEVPPRDDWTRTVTFCTTQMDVQFKKILIYLCVDCLKIFPCNKFMIESRHWLLGLMYLLDPGLCHLRARWSPSLFAELRKSALQALVCTLPLMPVNLVKDYGIIRRLMWYIEWYSESPYELPVLYWCARLLHVAIYHRKGQPRETALKDLFDTHGIIVLMHLCDTLLRQKLPPVEKSQTIIALCLRQVTSALDHPHDVSCCVYPGIKWPASVNLLAKKMIDVILYSLEKHFIINDRWLISLLNLIWQGIVWNPGYRETFIANNGIYKLLDVITMTRAPVQCVALAITCDLSRAGDAVGQMVTWRASLGASSANPNIVRRGSTIAALIASVFRDECRASGVLLRQDGVLEDTDFFLMSSETRKELNNPAFREGPSQRTVNCLTACDIEGSRMSKAFSLLYMLSEDLDSKVSLADESYNLYKNIQLAADDEAVLVLCSYFLTMKLNEVWLETHVQSQGYVPHDQDVLQEFLEIGRGWAKEVKQQQEDVIKKDREKEQEEESSLYAFLGRVRLTSALDALREVRCAARSAGRVRAPHVLLGEAARRARSARDTPPGAPLLRTYAPKLDDQNMTGQNVRVTSIFPDDQASLTRTPPT